MVIGTLYIPSINYTKLSGTSNEVEWVWTRYGWSTDMSIQEHWNVMKKRKNYSLREPRSPRSARVRQKTWYLITSTHRELSIAHVFVMFGPSDQALSTIKHTDMLKNLSFFGNWTDFSGKSGISSAVNAAKHYSSHQNTSGIDSVSSGQYLN